jgi:hypothetical protein
VSSDQIADLADSLADFAEAFRDVLRGNQWPAPGSPAATESETEPFAGEWGDYPSRDVLATTLLAAGSCADHLTATASVLRGRNSVFAPYTVMRAAAEAAAIGAYLTDSAIDGRERVRRNMNYRLDALCEQISLVGAFHGAEAARKAAWNKERLGDFARTASQHDFRFRKMDGPGRSAYLDKRQPAAMQLVDLAVDKDMPGLGAAYQRHLSSVAHAKLHGLTRFLTPLAGTPPEEARASINVSAPTIALELLAGPVCAASLISGLCWFTGWDMDAVARPLVTMLDTWGRIGGVPYPGSAAVVAALPPRDR